MKIHEFRHKARNQNHSEHRETNVVEKTGFLEFSPSTSAFKFNNMPLIQCFQRDWTGWKILRLVTSTNRFANLVNYLRFDILEEGMLRIKHDLVAVISHIFENMHFDKCWSVSEVCGNLRFTHQAII